MNDRLIITMASEALAEESAVVCEIKTSSLITAGTGTAAEAAAVAELSNVDVGQF